MAHGTSKPVGHHPWGVKKRREAFSVFHKIPHIDDSWLAELFGQEVLSELVQKELLRPEWAERILSWRHTGFSVHSQVSRLMISLPESFSETEHFQGGIKFPPSALRFATLTPGGPRRPPQTPLAVVRPS